MTIRSIVLWPLLAVVAVVALVVWWMQRDPPLAYGGIYAYDTGTGELYVTTEGVPPMPAPSGKEAGVRALVVRFAGEKVPTVVYLSTYTEAARRILLETGRVTAEVAAGTLVRRPADPTWVVAGTPEGQAIMNRAKELAEGRAWTVALPPIMPGQSP